MSLQLFGESVQPVLRRSNLGREMLRKDEEPLPHGSSVTIARVTTPFLRRAIDRAIAIPSSLLPKSEIDQRHIDSAAVPTSSLIRYATMMLGLTAACLPLYVVRWKYGPISTTLLELLIVVTIGLYLLGRRQEGTLRFNRTPYDVPIALLLLAGASAVFVPLDRWHALGLYRAYFVEPVAIFLRGGRPPAAARQGSKRAGRPRDRQLDIRCSQCGRLFCEFRPRHIRVGIATERPLHEFP